MRGKLLFITGGLIGYVLGARAGRKRYDQIVAAAENVWSAPPVQRRVNEARDFALERVGDVPSALLETGKKIVSTLQSKTAAGKTGRTTGTAYTVRTPAGPAATPPAATTPTPAATVPPADDTATK